MRAPRNQVLVLLMLIAAAACAFTGFVSEAPNRLTSDRPVPLWYAVSTPVLAGLCALALLLLAAAFIRPTRRWHAIQMMATAALLILLLHGAGEAAATLAQTAKPAARTLLGAAFWIAGLCTALALIDAGQRLKLGPAAKSIVALLLAAAIFALLEPGDLAQLSLAREYEARRGVFAGELLRHLALVFGAFVPALLIGLPLGLLARRRPRLQGPLFGTLNLLQTIPSIALFGLLIAPLSALATAVPALGTMGLRGIGATPALIALTLYALLPLARNAYAGIAGVDGAIVEAARGMGFTSSQIFWRVELPLGLPVFLAGARIALVQLIGLAVIAALIGAGGLGSFIFQGIGQYAVDLVLLGAIPTILLALGADFLLQIAIALWRGKGPA